MPEMHPDIKRDSWGFYSVTCHSDLWYSIKSRIDQECPGEGPKQEFAVAAKYDLPSSFVLFYTDEQMYYILGVKMGIIPKGTLQ